MGFKKRRKSSRNRGFQTAKRGAKERTRHSGNRGGYGMAGTGKMADQKKTLVLNLYGNDYFGKSKALRRGTAPIRPEVINLDSIESQLSKFIQKGAAKESKGAFELKLENYKILGDGDVRQKLHIIAHSASSSAVEKVQKAGGSVTLKHPKKEKPKAKGGKEIKEEENKTKTEKSEKPKVKPVAKGK